MEGNDADDSGNESDNSSLGLAEAFEKFHHPGYTDIEYVQGRGKYSRPSQIGARFPSSVPDSVMTAHSA